jgi:hypothetical protein
VVQAQSVNIQGKITDESGSPVAFASVYQKNTTLGTSANINGEFQLKLKPGKAELVFKAVGYTQQVRQVDVKPDLFLSISLKAESYQLKDIVVRAGAEDPAYAIIRNAIKKRKSHLNEVDSYSCDVYIKGLQKLLAAPKKFLGKDIEKEGKEIGLDSNRRGIIYLSESESRYSFKQPDQVHEEMISSKVSGRNQAFSFNRASEMNVNFYENLQQMGNLSNRPLISPIAENALSYYRYKYLGSAFENGLEINKIEVTPKRKGDPLFQGNIYIIEDSWRLSAADLMLTKDANINFVDTLKINQQFFPVGSGIWMPSTVKFDFKGGLFGFRFGGYFIAVYKNYDVNPKFEKNIFKEVMRVTKEVNKKDSAYWQESRPIPLTEEEKADYTKKKALAAKRESKPYLDSLDKANNKFKLANFILGSGYALRHRYSIETYRFSSLKDAVLYNTVEGLAVNYEVSYNKQIDSVSNRNLSLRAKARYGFANEKFHANFGGILPIRETTYGFNFGSDVLDLNSQGTISTRGNTINSLLFERNYQKLYQKQFVNLSATRRFGGLIFTLAGEFADRQWLPNATDFTFKNYSDREFTSNNPFSPSADIPLFPRNQALKIGINASYEFSKKYVTYPRGRFYLPSKYPRLSLSYSKGIKNALGSDVDYNLLAANITKSDVRLGLLGKLNFYVGAGSFLNNSKLFYPDYKHFSGNQAFAGEPRTNGFLYLDYYLHSTSENYLEAHLMHNFGGLFLNKVPLVRKLKLQEVIGGSYLTTPGYRNYSEMFYGVQYLNFRVVYGMAYEGGKQVDKGFRFAYGF